MSFINPSRPGSEDEDDRKVYGGGRSDRGDLVVAIGTLIIFSPCLFSMCCFAPCHLLIIIIDHIFKIKWTYFPQTCWSSPDAAATTLGLILLAISLLFSITCIVMHYVRKRRSSKRR